MTPTYKHRHNRYEGSPNAAIRLLFKVQESLPNRSIERDIVISAMLYLEGEEVSPEGRDPNASTVCRWWTKTRAQFLEDQRVRKIISDIGHGLRLAIPRQSGGNCRMIPDTRFLCECELEEEYEIPCEVAEAAVATEMLGEIPEHRANNKIGWKESGLPGDK